jgi:hypothetical protein
MSDIAIQRDGRLWWYGGRVVPTRRSIEALGTLLDSLLQLGPAGRTPAPLVYVVSRATEPRHLAPFGSLAEFRVAVTRHAPEQPAVAIDALLAQYFMAVSEHPPLDEHSTISDLRRLRRASGVALPTIADDTGVPLSLLRELEWGVFANWHPSHAAASLVAYAERAGLDPAKVMAVVSREQECQQPAQIGAALVPIAATVDVVRTKDSRWPRSRAADAQPSRGVLPFALAAVMFLAAAVAAPPDADSLQQMAAVHSPDNQSVQHETAGEMGAQPTATADETQDAESGAPSAVPVSHPRTVEQRRRTPSSAIRTQPRLRRTLAVSLADQPPPATRSAHPLVRFARAVAGDGRHKVEPFPRVQ